MLKNYIRIGNRKYLIPSKPFYQSKTLWIGLIGVVLEILQINGLVNIINPIYLSIIISALMIVLRFISTQPLGL